MVRHDGAGDVQHGELSEAGAEDVGVDLGQDHGLHTELPQLAACTGWNIWLGDSRYCSDNLD